jgi:hypothetical protein
MFANLFSSWRYLRMGASYLPFSYLAYIHLPLSFETPLPFTSLGWLYKKVILNIFKHLYIERFENKTEKKY